MKNWKDKVLGIFAGIGLMSLLMGSYTQQPQQYAKPESHVWEFHIAPTSGANIHGGRAYAINSVTGEVRKYSRGPIDKTKASDNYVVMTSVLAKPEN